jgi:nitroreductase
VVHADEPRAVGHADIFAAVDTYLAITSMRAVKRYSKRPLPEDVERRILEAGRLAGSGSNRQPWTFHVLESPELVDGLAKAVFAPENVLGAQLVVVVTVREGKGPLAFDAGRAAQNMLLAAWNEGVGASPNGFADRDRVIELLGLGEDDRPVIALSFGYPARPRNPDAHSPEDWALRAKRKPLDEIVRRL